MSMIINYNPMLMMLYNLKPNVLVISQLSNWDENENQLLSQAIKLQEQNPHLSLAVMNLETVTMMETGTYSLNTIPALANRLTPNIAYFIQYWMIWATNSQEGMFMSMKSLLNIQKIVINPNLMISNEVLDTKILTKVFGEKNVIFIDYVEPKQSLKDSQKLLKTGNVVEYFKTTSTHYQVKGEVVQGKQLGRVLGYPTANMRVNPKMLLKQGVYYVKVKLPNDQHLYDGMSSYWINEQNDYLIETYIFDFNKDIYGWFIQLQFQEYIRDNVKVQSQEELKTLLKKDAQWIAKHRQ